MKCRYKERLSIIQNVETVTAFKIIFSDAVLQGGRVTLPKNDERLQEIRDGILEEYERLLQDEFYENMDNIHLARSKAKKIRDELNIKYITDRMIEKLDLHSTNLSDFSMANLIFFCLSYYNICDKFYITELWQSKFINPIVKSYIQFMNEAMEICGENTQLFVNAVIEAANKKGVLTPKGKFGIKRPVKNY